MPYFKLLSLWACVTAAIKTKQKTVVCTQGLGTHLCPLRFLELECVNGGETLPVFGYEPYATTSLFRFITEKPEVAVTFSPWCACEDSLRYSL